ncbi:replication restart helicase PriA [Candidatus Paracaedibacter symbiosus]|uniref:replication restart helicase PriA n=1 Tax=Candidatus Paracaedibacter symbiosus TaxID=244582 RepID=UPI000509BF0C|nr:primosomal protein N' [Candidatus Paracaedibacter symbiosus]
MQHTVEVLLPLGVKTPFTYALPAEMGLLCVGDIVLVPFRGKELWGVVWQLDTNPYKGELKSIRQKAELPPLPDQFVTFLKRIADYNYFPLGLSLKLTLSQTFLETKKTRKFVDLTPLQLDHHTPIFSAEQQYAIDHMVTAIDTHRFQPIVLDGITGSGKTEVYLEAIHQTIKTGKQALVLLPEIALTNQMLARFEKRFGKSPLLWHSNVSPTFKRQTWQAVLKGEAQVIVGARSALFLPFPNLGLIIIDEEHDGSYKQEDQITYHARDMAVLRASLEQAPIVLVSATPSLETVQNIEAERYQKLTLSTRHGGAVLPSIHPIDMRQQPKGWLSPPLLNAIQKTLERQEQVMLFLNRRGYAPLTLCRQCGLRLTCPSCAVALVEHKHHQRLCCHHCGYSQTRPKNCPDCGAEDSFIPCGPGVERVHEQVCKRFPSARVEVLTSDTLTSVDLLSEVIEKIRRHEVDIIIGTQLLAKGHHFPLITLVGVIDADLGLSGGDLRCGERTYQLLHQVSGRAGREKHLGHVLLQTYSPDHPVMQSLCQQNRDQFNKLELVDRQEHHMPPFSRLVSLNLGGRDQTLVAETARQLGFKAPKVDAVQIFGPAPAPISYLRGKHRWRFLLKADKAYPIQRLLDHWLSQVKLPSSITLDVDVDPQSFY